MEKVSKKFKIYLRKNTLYDDRVGAYNLRRKGILLKMQLRYKR